MPRKRAEPLSPHDLAALGTEKLSELLIEAARRDESLAARLQRELTAGGPEQELAKLIRRQLRGLGGHDFVAWNEAGGLAAGIDSLRESIVRQVSSKSPRLAAELLGELVAADARILEGVDDSNGEVGDALGRVMLDWGAAWAEVGDADPEALADLVLTASEGNDYGIRDEIVPAFAKAFGRAGLERLEQRARAQLEKLSRRKGRQADEWDSVRSRLVQILRDVADARGDPDLFVEASRLGGVLEPYAVEIGRRMLRAGRAEEALRWVADADERDLHRGLEIAEVKAAALELLDRGDEAQQVRWRRVEARLDPDVLAAYLERLPSDGARAKARAEAQRIASAHEDPRLALWFLAEQGNLEALAEFATERIGELDGARYELLGPAAEALSGEPLAAALLHRRMVESVLDRGRSTAYDYAARDLRRAAACARRVGRGEEFEGHEVWVERLRTRHGRKRAFWSRAEHAASR